MRLGKPEKSAYFENLGKSENLEIFWTQIENLIAASFAHLETAYLEALLISKKVIFAPLRT